MGVCKWKVGEWGFFRVVHLETLTASVFGITYGGIRRSVSPGPLEDTFDTGDIMFAKVVPCSIIIGGDYDSL
jgi:hypothetical protein